MEHAKFIVIDGMDGSGKGTQIRFLQEKLTGRPVAFTREPGGAPKAEEIRHMLLRQDGPESTPECDFFLFCAARAAHLRQTIVPLLLQGTHVICDRYESSTHAFQICGEKNMHLKKLHAQVSLFFSGLISPAQYIILDLPEDVAFERRAGDATQEQSRFDVKPLEYHRRVREGFQEFAAMRKNVHIVDAHRSREDVHADIWKLVSCELGM